MVDDPAPLRLLPGSPVTVTLVKSLRQDLLYGMTVTHDDGDHILVEGSYHGPADRDLGYVTLEVGDHFSEHYWRSRWYSVKEVRHSTGWLKGWYCDIARPVRVEAGAVTSVDLELDVWVSSDGTEILTLDVDEFVRSGIELTDPTAAEHALRAVDELRAAAEIDLRMLF